jgi:hypothetical protein
MEENQFRLYINSPSYFEKPTLILKTIDLIDQMLPTYEFKYRLTATDYVEIENREEYVLNKLKEGNLVLCNNLPGNFLHLQGLPKSAIERLNSHAFARTVIEIPGEERNISIMNSLVINIGDTMEAYYLDVGSPAYNGRISNGQIMFSHRSVEEIPYGLPPVADFARHNLVDYQFPRFVYWINYWSKEIAEAVEFNYERDKDLFHECFQTPLGSWILRITAAPLDVKIPEHLGKLKKIYKRYPKVGRQDLLLNDLK